MLNQPFAFRSLPPVTKALVAVSAGLFLLQWGLFQFLGVSLVPWLGLVPARVTHQFWLWQAVTYMFLHGGIFHFILNMFILWSFGRELEFQWGSRFFAGYYFLCGTGAAFFNILFTPNSFAASIGASGAIYGLLVAFAMVYPHAILHLWFFIPFKAWQAVVLLAAIELMSAVSSAGSGAAALAHLGGMLTGYLFLKWRVWRYVSFDFSGIFKKVAKWRPGDKKDVPLHELGAEVDRILDKILKNGVGSLTRQEQELMDKYSKRRK